MVDRSDLCSSVNDSSQVIYTVSSSLMSRSLSCRTWNSVETEDSCSENQPSWPRFLITHTKRTCRVTAPGCRPKIDRRLFPASAAVFSLQPWTISRSKGRVNVPPVLPANRTTLSNWRNGRKQPYGPSIVTVFSLLKTLAFWLPTTNVRTECTLTKSRTDHMSSRHV